MNFVQNIENWVKRTASLDNSLEGRRFAPFLDLTGTTVLKSLKGEISDFIGRKEMYLENTRNNRDCNRIQGIRL